MISRKIIPISMKDMIFIVVWSGIFALTGCVTSPLTRDGPGQTDISHTPITTPGYAPIEGTEVATTTPTLTQALVPSPTLPKVIARIEETFVDNRNQWRTDPGLITIEAGIYNHKIDCPDAHVSLQCGTFIRMPFTFPRNFRMELDATLVRLSTGASILVGFQVRRSDIEYYFITYTITDRSYQMSYISQTGETTILPETSTDFIVTDLGETNRLGIEVSGATFTPLVTGQELPPLQDRTIRDAGDSYLVILVSRGHSAEIQFDDLVVQEVK